MSDTTRHKTLRFQCEGRPPAKVWITKRAFSLLMNTPQERFEQIGVLSLRQLISRGDRLRAGSKLDLLVPMADILRRNFSEAELATKDSAKRNLTIAQHLIPINPEAKSDALWLLQYEEFRTAISQRTISRVLKNAVCQAIDQGDIDFFKRLGRRLSQKSRPIWPNIELNPLQALIVSNWARKSREELQFCYFTDQALADFIGVVRKDVSPTFDSVRQIRKRLRLKMLRPRIISRVMQNGDQILLDGGC